MGFCLYQYWVLVRGIYIAYRRVNDDVKRCIGHAETPGQNRTGCKIVDILFITATDIGEPTFGYASSRLDGGTYVTRAALLIFLFAQDTVYVYSAFPVVGAVVVCTIDTQDESPS